jgi:hypothetical protein
MAVLTNHSRFAVDVLRTHDQDARHLTVVIVSATFEVPPGGRLRPADEQSPVREGDVHRGDPAASSVIYEGEFASGKPKVDVLVNGTAYAPGGRKVEHVLIGIRVGDISKQLRVRGNRFWKTGLLGTTPSAPEPFETMPIIYERAFGGIDTRAQDSANHVWYRPNPVGVGFRGAPPARPDLGTDVPNIEDPSVPVTSPSGRYVPAGLGVMGRSWTPRIEFAGTYDAAWVEDQCPLLPHDFDPRFYQAAPADQQSATLRGGEPVELRNLTPEGLWTFTLPTLHVPVRLFYLDKMDHGNVRLDTVLLEPDFYRVTLIARHAFVLDRRRGPPQELVFGHCTLGWERARSRKKEYLDKTGRQGREVGVEDYSV